MKENPHWRVFLCVYAKRDWYIFDASVGITRILKKHQYSILNHPSKLRTGRFWDLHFEITLPSVNPNLMKQTLLLSFLVLSFFSCQKKVDTVLNAETMSAQR